MRGVRGVGVLPYLVRWARHAGTIDFCPALAALVSPVQHIIFLTAHFFTLLVTWAGSRAGSPVSVSLVIFGIKSSSVKKQRRPKNFWVRILRHGSR
jgi:hypothetical protein